MSSLPELIVHGSDDDDKIVLFGSSFVLKKRTMADLEFSGQNLRQGLEINSRDESVLRSLAKFER